MRRTSFIRTASRQRGRERPRTYSGLEPVVIVIDYGRQGGERSVVHVWRPLIDVAQSWGFECMLELDDAGGDGGATAIIVAQAYIMEAIIGHAPPGVNNRKPRLADAGTALSSPAIHLSKGAVFETIVRS